MGDETEDKLAPILAHCRMLGYEPEDWQLLALEAQGRMLKPDEPVFVSFDGTTWTERAL